MLAVFADWLAEHRPRVPPRSAIGEAFTSVTNQWGTLSVYLTDGRLAIHNASAEQAICLLCVGRCNWLHLGGDGGLKPMGVTGADLADLLLDRLAASRGGSRSVVLWSPSN